MLDQANQTKHAEIEYVAQMSEQLAKMANKQDEALLAKLLQICAREGREILRANFKLNRLDQA